MNRATIRLFLILFLAGRTSAQEVLFEYFGQGPGTMGTQVAGLGDVDRDGVVDFATVENGQVHVYSGASGSMIRSHTGSRVARLGDVDLDGHADVLLFRAGNPDAVQVYSGRTGLMLYQAPEPRYNSKFGNHIDGVGDTNGDQVPDFVVSAPEADTAFSNAGSVYLYSGADGSLRFQVDGVAPNQYIGSRMVVGVGDVNGDGFGDFAHTRSLMVDVYSGREGGLLHTLTGGGGTFGSAVCGVGDMNGDGKDDVLVGEYRGENPAGYRAGTVYIFSGANGQLMRTLWGDHHLDQLGVYARDIGDIDGDGYEDFGVLGNPVYETGYVRLYSGADASVLRSFTVDESIGNRAYHLLDSVGDVNGDGRAEWILGNPQDNTLYPGGGRFAVYSGACFVQVQRYCVTSPNSAGSGAQVGYSGSLSIADATFELRCRFAAPGQPGLFLYGPDRVQTYFGDGVRCIGDVAHRLPQLMTTPAGFARRPLDFGAPPSSAAQIHPGERWNFQFLYRDPAAGVAGWNLSDAVSIRFCP